MNRYINKYRHDREHKLRLMQYKIQKQYWKYLNSINVKPRTNHTSLNDFYKYFKDINENGNTQSSSADVLNDTSFEDDDDILSAKITEEEISTCINELNNGKSPGNDHILNEHIKSSKHLFMQLYICLFNGILDSGIMPDSWIVGNICQMYKNKGDSLLPENYRPIMILSCLGKLFTSVINQRLVRYLNENDLLSETQTGFGKDYSTLDNIFTLHSIIELLKLQRKKLFCCFIDFF